MRTYREYISQVKDLFKEINADSRLTNKQVWSLILKHAKWIIRRDSNKLNLLGRNTSFKEVKCLPVVEAQAHECCDIGYNCKVWRTKDKLPSLFEDSDGVIISKVTSVDGWTPIYLISPNEFRRMKNNPWRSKNKSKKIYAYYHNGYIFFPEKKLERINVEGLYSESVRNKSQCEEPCKDCNTPCDRFLDEPAPIPDYLAAQIIDLVIRDLANTYSRIPEKANEINKNSNSPS